MVVEAAWSVERVVREGFAPVGEDPAAPDGWQLFGIADGGEAPLVGLCEVHQAGEVGGRGHACLVEVHRRARWPPRWRVAVAREKGRPGSPVVIADAADNPGGGGYGDSAKLLRALVDSGIDKVAFGALFDPETAAACHKAGVGASLPVRLGGKVDGKFGPPVEGEATVLALSDGKFRFEGPMQRGVPVDMGPSAAVRIGGVDVVVASRRYQNYDRMFFLSLGIDPGTYAVVAVKSSQHFRAAYQPLASEVVVVDEGNGITTQDIRSRTYKDVRRPIYPLDLT